MERVAVEDPASLGFLDPCAGVGGDVGGLEQPAFLTHLVRVEGTAFDLTVHELLVAVAGGPPEPVHPCVDVVHRQTIIRRATDDALSRAAPRIPGASSARPGHGRPMDSLPLWLLVMVFVAGAGVIWVAGIQLSKTTDVLDARLHLGSALGGLIVLAVATNLPEIAITVSAGLSGSIEVAAGNILGGIALQTVVIAVIDAFGKRGKGVAPITYRAASLTLVLEAVVVVAVLGVVIAGSQLPPDLVVARLTPDVVLIAVIWLVGLLLVQRAGKGLPWHEDGRAPDASPHASGHRTRTAAEPAMSTRRAAIVQPRYTN